MALVTIPGGFQLEAAPAASYGRALAAGCPRGITSAYRTPEAQAVLRAAYLKSPTTVAYAAPVADSEHVTGYALDLPAGAAAWMRAHPEHGFMFTDSREWWHVAYRASRDRLLSVITPPAPIPEDDMTTEESAALARIDATVAGIANAFGPLADRVAALERLWGDSSDRARKVDQTYDWSEQTVIGVGQIHEAVVPGE
jgi:hypothetical protein